MFFASCFAHFLISLWSTCSVLLRWGCCFGVPPFFGGRKTEKDGCCLSFPRWWNLLWLLSCRLPDTLQIAVEAASKTLRLNNKLFMNYPWNRGIPSELQDPKHLPVPICALWPVSALFPGVVWMQDPPILPWKPPPRRLVSAGDERKPVLRTGNFASTTFVALDQYGHGHGHLQKFFTWHDGVCVCVSVFCFVSLMEQPWTPTLCVYHYRIAGR